MIKTGSPTPILLFAAYNDDGTPKFDLNATTAGLSLEVFRLGLTPIPIPAPVDKAADDTPHAAGAIRLVSDNRYSIDVSAAAAGSAGQIELRGSFTGGTLRGQSSDVVAYDPADAELGIQVLKDLLDGGRLDLLLDALTAGQTAIIDRGNVAWLTGAGGTGGDALEATSQQIKAVTDKLEAMIEADAALFRFNANALEQAPTGAGAGGGGDHPLATNT